MLASAIVFATLASRGNGPAVPTGSLVLTDLCSTVLMNNSNVTLVMSNLRLGAKTPAEAASNMTTIEVELAGDASDANKYGFANVARATLAMKAAVRALAVDVAAQNPTAESHDQYTLGGAADGVSSACIHDGGEVPQAG
jgi:hypothetical protein